MTTITYPKFTVKTDIKLPIKSIEDINSYIRIVVSPKQAPIINEGELSLITAANILSGNERLCLKALNDILENRKYKFQQLNSIINNEENNKSIETYGIVKFFNAQEEQQIKLICPNLNPENYKLNQRIKIILL